MSEILTLPPKLPKSQNAEVGASKFCPGCGHGITLKALAKAIDELGIQQKTVFGCDIGCSLLAWNYMDLDTVQTGCNRYCIYGRRRRIGNWFPTPCKRICKRRKNDDYCS